MKFIRIGNSNIFIVDIDQSGIRASLYDIAINEKQMTITEDNISITMVLNASHAIELIEILGEMFKDEIKDIKNER